MFGMTLSPNALVALVDEFLWNSVSVKAVDRAGGPRAPHISAGTPIRTLLLVNCFSAVASNGPPRIIGGASDRQGSSQDASCRQKFDHCETVIGVVVWVTSPEAGVFAASFRFVAMVVVVPGAPPVLLMPEHASVV